MKKLSFIKIKVQNKLMNGRQVLSKRGSLLSRFDGLKAIFQLWLFLLGGLSVHGEARDMIEITHAGLGNSLTVEVMNLRDGEIQIKLESGDIYTLPTDLLTSESINQARLFLETKATELVNINKFIGQPLFNASGTLWEQPASDTAKRLRWPVESKGASSSSYRKYTRADYSFLGAHPYCATLYGSADGHAELFSLVFANKGDFGSKMGMGEDHFKKIHPDANIPKSLSEAIELDAQVLTKSLSDELGEPKQQYYGEKEDKRKVLRWDLNGHSFILSQRDEEYVSLLIVPISVADAEGKVELVKDSDMKVIIAKNVQRGENGDVLVTNIPMVNQGPKGYCAPATAERAMRYMLVPADMYLLAVAATSAEGGTNTTALMESCKRIVRSKARKIRDLNLEKDLNFKTLKKYIDKGVPILWQMRSLDQYNKIANRRTKERREVTDFVTWAETIKAESKDVVSSLKSIKENHHICMIIGYNEKTNEVAVSDSWGIRYELRWVHIDIARAVTSRGGFVIDF
jgi:hypothetical protein